MRAGPAAPGGTARAPPATSPRGPRPAPRPPARDVALAPEAPATRTAAAYARIDGTVVGHPVAAVVHVDGTVTGDHLLLRRVLGPGRTVADDPLLATIRLARACDRVAGVSVHAAGSRCPSTLPAAGRCDRLAATPGPDCGSAPGPASCTCAGMEATAQLDPLVIEIVERGDGHLAHLRGELDFAQADRVRAALEAAGTGPLVVEVSGLRFIDAGGVAAILAVHRTLSDRGSRLVVEGAAGLVRRVFELTDLAHLLGS